jgi:hypothetical protein
MPPSASTAHRSRSTAGPRLRLLPKRQPQHERRGPSGPIRARRLPSLAPSADAGARESDAPVLIAGADAGQRADLLEQLSRTMPQNTRFEQAEAVWEVLVHAPESRMVVLSGDLDELPAESLLHALGHRHPDLPVVSFGRSSPSVR